MEACKGVNVMQADNERVRNEAIEFHRNGGISYLHTSNGDVPIDWVGFCMMTGTQTHSTQSELFNKAIPENGL